MVSFFTQNFVVLLRWKQSLRRKVSLSVAPNSILFVETTRLGDVVAMLPAMQSFKDAFPEAHISVAVEEQYAAMFSFLPWVNKVHSLGNTRRMRGLLESRAMLSRESSDLSCSMSPSIRNAFLTLGTTSSYTIGYLGISKSLTPFLDHPEISSIGIALRKVPPYHRENIVRRGGKVCEAFGIPFHNRVQWEIPDGAKQQARIRFSDCPPTSAQPLIVIHPFAGWKYREWGTDRYLSLAPALAGENTVVLAGVGDEIKQLSSVLSVPAVRDAAKSEGKNIEIFESSNLAEFIPLLSQAALFIGGDSGPLHLAASLGVPYIGLFGPANPEYTGPISTGGLNIYHRMDCSPCRQLSCIHPNRPCMDLIRETEVLAAANRILRGETVRAQ